MGRCVAVITARGGSKRIPGKNIKDFCGKPIIAYSIEAAKDAQLFDDIMVSTDDNMIKEISLKYGADVPFMRSKKTSDDYATTTDVLLEVIEQYKEMGKDFDYLCCIYPTAPFVTGKKLREAMQLIKEKKVDTVMPVVEYSFPPQRGMIIENHQLRFQYPEYSQCRSQDLEKVYHDCGQFYCINVSQFMKYKKLVMEKSMAIITNEMEVQDIDNFTDWEIAEMKYRIIRQGECK